MILGTPKGVKNSFIYNVHESVVEAMLITLCPNHCKKLPVMIISILHFEFCIVLQNKEV